MIALDANIVRGIMGSVGLMLVYGLSLWRIFKSNPGDKFIECGSIAVMLLLVILASRKIPHFPSWILTFLMVLLYVMIFVSIFFMLQQGYRALRGRKTH